AVIRHGPSDALPDPPGRISRELEAAAVLEPIHRLHQTDVAFLYEIEQRQPPAEIALRDRDDETQIGLDQTMFRVEQHLFPFAHVREVLLELQPGEAGPRLEVADRLGTLRRRQPLGGFEFAVDLAQGGDDIVDDRRPDRQVADGRPDPVVRTLDRGTDLRPAGSRRTAITQTFAPAIDFAFQPVHASERAQYRIDF